MNRRRFLQASASVCGAALLTGIDSRAKGFQSANARPRLGVIGCGSRWSQKATIAGGPWGIGEAFTRFADIVTVCDVDANRVGRAQGLVKDWLGSKPAATDDYRKVIDDKTVDVVHISTPDHWHTKIAIEAMLAGKDVYCEKPLTLTIEEGQKICDVCRKTGAIFQVGTGARSSAGSHRLVALLRDRRIGDLKKVQTSLGSGKVSPRIPAVAPPAHFNWDRWLGPAPMAEYRFKAGAQNEMKSWSRSHYEFRWWYEYSGGKLTDIGIHHVDIITWAMGKEDTGPISVDPIMVKHPVEFRNGYPVEKDQYNTATEFKIRVTYADGVELTIGHDLQGGTVFEGTEGKLDSAGRVTGNAADALASNPLPDDAVKAVYKGRELNKEKGVDPHVANFFEAIADGVDPISDVYSHHRALTTCHLAVIAARLGRKIQWDPKTEKIVGDAQAQAMTRRQNRKGYEIEMS